MDKLSEIYPKDVLMDVYHMAIDDDVFSCWCINLAARPRPQIWIRFGKRLVVKES